MFQGILRRLCAHFATGPANDEVNEDTRFVPSALDASVREAHGGSQKTVEGELADIVEHAQELENTDHERGNR